MGSLYTQMQPNPWTCTLDSGTNGSNVCVRRLCEFFSSGTNIQLRLTSPSAQQHLQETSKQNAQADSLGAMQKFKALGVSLCTAVQALQGQSQKPVLLSQVQAWLPGSCCLWNLPSEHSVTSAAATSPLTILHMLLEVLPCFSSLFAASRPW